METIDKQKANKRFLREFNKDLSHLLVYSVFVGITTAAVGIEIIDRVHGGSPKGLAIAGLLDLGGITLMIAKGEKIYRNIRDYISDASEYITQHYNRNLI